jgi:methylated-DNA-[protein]-cysteine S-methyltransferase
MKTETCFDRVTGPLGTMLVVATDGALSGTYFDSQKYAPMIAADWRCRPDATVLRAARAQLAAYFAGELQRFELPLAPAGTVFQQAVWTAIGAVPFGETLAYHELAERAGHPSGVRAAGAAVGRNPLSIVVPCHRIIGADGGLTGYAGGLDRKRALLAHEATSPHRGGLRDAARCGAGIRPSGVFADRRADRKKSQ